MIRVLDSIMGSGKSSLIIQEIQEAGPDEKIIYIAPFRKEVQRVVSACPGFIAPERKEREGLEESNATKSNHLKNLLQAGKNIAATHALFQLIDDEALNLLSVQEYRLYLDEVPEICKEKKVKDTKISSLFDKEILVEGKVDHFPRGTITWAKAGPETGLGAYFDIQALAAAGRLAVLNKDYAMLWMFNPTAFDMLDNITVATYVFEGQPMNAYLKLYGIPYRKQSIIRKNGKYRAVDYDPALDSDRIREARKLINIYSGKLNDKWKTVARDDDEKGQPFSKTWYQSNPRLRSTIKADLSNYFKNVVKGKASESMWSCFKKDKKVLSAPKNRHSLKNWVQCHERATNEYRDRKNLAYMVNVFMPPVISRLFWVKEIEVEHERFGLHVLIQWIWRSAIREGKPINLYLPSDRMRGILNKWFDQAEVLQEP